MNKEEKKKKVVMIGSSAAAAGLVSGLLYAYKKEKGLLGYVGFGLLFSAIGLGLGVGSSMYFIKSEENVNSSNSNESSDLPNLKNVLNANNAKSENKDVSTKKIDVSDVVNDKKASSYVLEKDKAEQIFNFWLKKKDEIKSSSMPEAKAKIANSVLTGLQKTLDEGGWKIYDNKLIKK